ncbi:MAG: metallophosphoesterase family protein [Thermodesulfobacteriota bacterium]
MMIQSNKFVLKISKRLFSKFIISFLISLILLTISCDNNTPGGIIATWIQMGSSGSIIARAITENSECPFITLDNTIQQMQVRAEPSEPDFPVLVCEILIPPNTNSAFLGDEKLHLPKTETKRIAIIGDTGCRISSSDAQACNNPEAWPFEMIAKNVTSWEPELVIHVGDYIYREAPCPLGNSGCAGSPFGDNWETWEADFFSPASALLNSAPWVFTRGNHEMCTRAGEGWFRFLDYQTPLSNCVEFTEPFAIDIGIVRLLMLDSASADDFSAPPELVEIYADQIAKLSELANDNSWFVTHRPIWGVGEFDDEIFTTNPTLQSSTGNSLKAGINLVLSGHLHLFEMLRFNEERSPQFIVGNGGTKLDSTITVPLDGLEITGAIIDQGLIFDNFGFVTMENVGNNWKVSVRDVKGKEIIPCEIQGNVASCDQ